MKIESKPGCLQSAIEILGSKWTGLIIRELASGPKRFCELERAIPTLNPRTLSKRLSDLEYHQIINRRDTSAHYELTEKGSDLIPILRKMAEWGERYPLQSHHNLA